MKFEDEIICGHLVTAETKKLWAVEMNLAQKLIDVCNKHNLKIWAIGGTLLGAVRHKGFIPWDDDMDFAMFREDFDVLMKIGPKEFEYPYFFQSCYTDHVYGGMAKIRNSQTAYIQNNYKYSKTENWGIGIDVFVIDAIPENLDGFEKNYKYICLLRRIVNNYRVYSPRGMNFKTNLFSFFCSVFFRIFNVDYVEKIIRRLLMNKSIDDCAYCSTVDFYATVRYPLHKVPKFEKECFSHTDYIDFQGMKIPVPAGRDSLLRACYGDYMKFVKGTSFHDGSVVVVDTERSYKEILKQMD